MQAAGAIAGADDLKTGFDAENYFSSGAGNIPDTKLAGATQDEIIILHVTQTGAETDKVIFSFCKPQAETDVAGIIGNDCGGIVSS